MDVIIKIILSIGGVVINYLFFTSYFKPKFDNNKLKMVMIIGTLGLAGSTTNLFSSNSLINSTVTILTLYIVGITMFYGGIAKKIFLGIVFILFSLVLELLITFMTVYFINKSLLDIVDNPDIPILSLLFYYFVEFVIIWSLKHKRIRNEISLEISIYLKQIIIPLISLISIFFVVKMQLTNGNINYKNTAYIIAFLVIINIAQYHIYEKFELLYQNYFNTMLLFHKSAIILEIVNSTDGKVRDLATRKTNVKAHGLGIKSILSIMEKYHGDCEFKMNDHSFRLQLNMWEL